MEREFDVFGVFLKDKLYALFRNRADAELFIAAIDAMSLASVDLEIRPIKTYDTLLWKVM